MAARSFDLFDTLLGRLYYHPTSIFELVEKQSQLPGFMYFRMTAEHQSDRTLPDIYQKFQELTGISKEQSQALMQMEFEIELSQVYPIVENLNLVNEGDLIVSDTNYNTEQIRQILEKIGLKTPVHIYATPFGKSSGTIWETLKHKHAISSHLGDSLHSDVAMPTSKNIEATHYTNSQFSSHEQKMVEFDQADLACLMRTLRLQNPCDPHSPEYLIWNDQCQFNVPLLLHASLYLDAFCKENGKKRILFTARDGCLWIQLFKVLYPEYDAVYFHSSRYMYQLPTPSFIAYAKSHFTPDCVVVDSHGKGNSCYHFFKSHLNCAPTYLAIVNLGKKYHGIIRRNTICEGIEKMNYDLVGTLYDVQENTPLRAAPEYNLRYIEPMHSCIKKCVELLPHYKVAHFSKQVVKWALKKMESGLVLDEYVDHAVRHIHIAEGKSRLRHIHLLRSGRQLEM
jgi:hypothetical protein